jgi:hypothetical protein
MNDSEMRKAFKELKQKRHKNWKAQNLNMIRNAGIPCDIKEEVVLFRESKKPMIDFYPSTGRWRIVGGRKQSSAISGGAKKFLEWYRKQEQKQEQKSFLSDIKNKGDIMKNNRPLTISCIIAGVMAALSILLFAVSLILFSFGFIQDGYGILLAAFISGVFPGIAALVWILHRKGYGHEE